MSDLAGAAEAYKGGTATEGIIQRRKERSGGGEDPSCVLESSSAGAEAFQRDALLFEHAADLFKQVRSSVAW
jgi:hypothetical protein